jgi:SulP family sulfate permease
MFTGLFVIVGVLLFANLIMALPMSSLAAVLILAGFQSIKPAEIRQVWFTNHVSAFVMVLTLVATLYLPVHQAIMLGLVIQVFLYIYQAAERMTIMELTPTADGDFVERPSSSKLPDREVTMLLPYGSLFFAAARDFEEEAPEADDVDRAAVIIVLRGRDNLGSTAIEVFEKYEETIQRNGGRLFLADVSDPVRSQLEKTGLLSSIGAENVLRPQEGLTASLHGAYEHAHDWLATVDPATTQDEFTTEE